ncbi:head GIN domain-containing protein [Teredinibacter haidensis]|uniref:head GIN domain-containing protein n=1 Tax=Teredinibacter haidensis TaxID=2731755 RepID=UPI0009490B5F|nr:head GIN domain-containing protein [Teredinibacter haidensis]
MIKQMGFGLALMVAAMVGAMSAVADDSSRQSFEERVLAEFSRIKLETPGDVKVVVGEAQKVVIYADPKTLTKIKTKSDDSTLYIKHHRWMSGSTNIRVEITLPVLDAAYISGSGSFDIENLNSDEFSVHISGSGRFVANGVAKKLNARISGAGSIDATGVDAASADVHISGSGRVKVKAQDNLDVHISGSGSVLYRGDPKLSTRISGSGSIDSME